MWRVAAEGAGQRIDSSNVGSCGVMRLVRNPRLQIETVSISNSSVALALLAGGDDKALDRCIEILIVLLGF